MIEFSSHAKQKLKERAISEEEVIKSLQNPDYLFLDSETGNTIAIAPREKPNHHLVIAFREVEGKIKIISGVEKLIERRGKRSRL